MRRAFALTAVVAALASHPLAASEYCYNQYSSSIDQANHELASLIQRQATIDDTVRKLFAEIAQDGADIAALYAKDPNLDLPGDRARMNFLVSDMNSANQNKSTLIAEGIENDKKIDQLKTTVPAQLAGELSGCESAVKPANDLVNFLTQSLLIISTGGAAEAILPKKAAYIDMGEVLHGKPLGGDQSAFNKARNDAEKALGISGDAQKVINNPIQCVFNALGGKSC